MCYLRTWACSVWQLPETTQAAKGSPRPHGQSAFIPIHHTTPKGHAKAKRGETTHRRTHSKKVKDSHPPAWTTQACRRKRPSGLTRSSFFCIQLYFLLEFSSRGSRKFFSGSEKGLSSTSFSMWLLAASRLSREGRTTKFGSAPEEAKGTSQSVLGPGPLVTRLHPPSQPS